MGPGASVGNSQRMCEASTGARCGATARSRMTHLRESAVWGRPEPWQRSVGGCAGGGGGEGEGAAEDCGQKAGDKCRAGTASGVQTGSSRRIID